MSPLKNQASTPLPRVAAVQMVSGMNLDDNLAQAERLIAEAVGLGAELVALPEYFCLMGKRDEDKLLIKEQEGSGPIQAFLSAQARRHQIVLLGGTLPLDSNDPGRVFNTSMAYGPAGTLLARYDKIHLFNFTRGMESYDEARCIVAGDRPVVLDVPWGRVGLSTCYDLRFPELYRSQGVLDLIVVPAAFTYTTGQAHWEILLRARAIENQCFVLAAAQGGTHPNGRRTWGHSMLIDPWGEVLQCLPEGPGIVVGPLDLARQAQIRIDLPAWRHRVL